NSGAAYVFTRSAGVWAQQAYLKASNAGANHNFGGRVAVLGDLLAVSSWTENSDGTGINGEQGNSNAPLSGAVYLFTRSGGMWIQKAYLKASNSNADYEFGVSLALTGDSLAVGAYREDSNATGINGNQADNSAPNSGAVYFFSLGDELSL
ncbi:MAG: Integrin alpha beta-propellor repeat protein, partial [Nitrospira sp.]|nr:Integrin alpha beta-propellor repeat protein [Nitrospira sp.]